jgi:hypothetical protein
MPKNNPIRPIMRMSHYAPVSDIKMSVDGPDVFVMFSAS